MRGSSPQSGATTPRHRALVARALGACNVDFGYPAEVRRAVYAASTLES